MRIKAINMFRATTQFVARLLETQLPVGAASGLGSRHSSAR
jgi:hypothetical protein